eukprot:15790737-Heterocapsa_arctica.AAC.1
MVVVDVAAATGSPGPREPGHPAYRAILCRNIAEKGKCSFRDKCSFSHDTSNNSHDNDKRVMNDQTHN